MKREDKMIKYVLRGDWKEEADYANWISAGKLFQSQSIKTLKALSH